MKNIKILSKLDIVDGNLVTKGTKHNHVFLKQGTIDGACGPYCMFMSLIILGIIKSNELYNTSVVDGRKKFGKLVAQLDQFGQFFNDGTDVDDIEDMITASYPKNLKSNRCQKKGKELTDFVIGELKKDFPVMVGVFGSKLEHWLLAVGFEENKNGAVEKLLFLCPSSETPISYWNAAVRIDKQNKGKYPFNWVDYVVDESKAVQLNQAISFGSVE